ncbi:hypothetical protein F4678DRAFT_425725 [Xylaria arbuscula]|nr:hypothetical protein F4678DRAFT_425725 [Xylaria arbuscula]
MSVMTWRRNFRMSALFLLFIPPKYSLTAREIISCCQLRKLHWNILIVIIIRRRLGAPALTNLLHVLLAFRQRDPTRRFNKS